jgi:hypothetical protein
MQSIKKLLCRMPGSGGVFSFIRKGDGIEAIATLLVISRDKIEMQLGT